MLDVLAQELAAHDPSQVLLLADRLQRTQPRAERASVRAIRAG